MSHNYEMSNDISLFYTLLVVKINLNIGNCNSNVLGFF